MNSTWIVVTNAGEAAPLLQTLTCGQSDANVLVVGSRKWACEASYGSSAVFWIDTKQEPIENYTEAAARVILKESSLEPGAIIGYASPATQAIIGAISASLSAPLVSNVLSVDTTKDPLCVEHNIIDNKVIETLEVQAPVCLLRATLTFQPEDPDTAQPQAVITEVSASSSGNCTMASVEEIPDSGVESADYVVGIGRGVGNQEKFEECKKLANLLGAELSGSMTGVKDMGFFPEGADYVGLSGVRLNAHLYLALGISGSTPHLSGIINTKTVVCVNNDPNARLFNYAKYGLVADIEEAVPALIDALQN